MAQERTIKEVLRLFKGGQLDIDDAQKIILEIVNDTINSKLSDKPQFDKMTRDELKDFIIKKNLNISPAISETREELIERIQTYMNDRKVYKREECVFKYCPTPETCKALDKCHATSS